MTCPIDALPEFDLEHWDVYELCRLMKCGECTAEDGEGVFWDAGGPMTYANEPGVCDDWDIPF
jgi:hypothetical protein